MPGLPTSAFRAVGPDDTIPDGFVAPFYLNDRKLRVAVAHVGDHHDASDDLCTRTCHAGGARGGESDG